jgi:hypothetical protein
MDTSVGPRLYPEQIGPDMVQACNLQNVIPLIGSVRWHCRVWSQRGSGDAYSLFWAPASHTNNSIDKHARQAEIPDKESDRRPREKQRWVFIDLRDRE